MIIGKDPLNFGVSKAVVFYKGTNRSLSNLIKLADCLLVLSVYLEAFLMLEIEWGWCSSHFGGVDADKNFSEGRWRKMPCAHRLMTAGSLNLFKYKTAKK